MINIAKKKGGYAVGTPLFSLGFHRFSNADLWEESGRAWA